MRMNVWTKHLFVVLSVGGGFCGAVLMTRLIPRVEGITSSVLLAAMIATFAFGVFAGLRFMEDEEKGLGLLSCFFAIQIPIFSSPVLTYDLISGFGVKLLWMRQWGLFFRFGSEMTIWIMHPQPWGLGVNAFALALFLWTRAILKKKGQQTEPPLLDDQRNT
jgi:hypothetical protein